MEKVIFGVGAFIGYCVFLFSGGFIWSLAYVGVLIISYGIVRQGN